MDRGDDIFAPESLAALDAALEEVARELDEDEGPIDRDVATRRDRPAVGTQTLTGGSPIAPLAEKSAGSEEDHVRPEKTTLVVGGKTVPDLDAAASGEVDAQVEAQVEAQVDGVEAEVEAEATSPPRDPAPPTTKNELGRRGAPTARERAAAVPSEAVTTEAGTKSRKKKRRRPKSEPPPAAEPVSEADTGASTEPPSEEPAPPTRESAKPSAPTEAPDEPRTAHSTRGNDKTQPSPLVLPADAPRPWPERAYSTPPRASASPPAAPSTVGPLHVVAGLAIALGIGFIAGRGTAPETEESAAQPKALPVSTGSPVPKRDPVEPAARPVQPDAEPPSPRPATSPQPEASTAPEAEQRALPKGVWPSPTGDGEPAPAPRPDPPPPQPVVVPAPPPAPPPKPTPKGPDKSFVPEDI